MCSQRNFKIKFLDDIFLRTQYTLEQRKSALGWRGLLNEGLCAGGAQERSGGFLAMIKSILVPVRGDGMVATVLAHAAELARQHQAEVNVVHCRAQAKDLMPTGIPLNDFARKVMMEQAVELANRQEDHLRGILHRLAREFGLSEEADADGSVICTF